MNSRIEYIDNIKGICMLAVIISHFIFRMGNDNCMMSFITTWNVSLFFVASGFFTKNIASKNFFVLLKNKACSLLLPYLSFSVISPFFLGWDKMSRYWLETGKGGLWFLPCLFIMFLVLYVCTYVSRESRVLSKYPICSLVLIALFVEILFIGCFAFLFPKSWIGPTMIHTLALYWPYFVIGHLMESNENFVIKDLFASCCGLIFFVWWGCQEFYGIENKIFQQLARVCSVFFLWYVFKNYKSFQTKMINIIGINTLYIYIVHYFFLDGIANIVEYYTQGNDFLEFIIFLVLSIVISYLCIFVKNVFSTSKYLSFLLWGDTIK